MLLRAASLLSSRVRVSFFLMAFLFPGFPGSFFARLASHLLLGVGLLLSGLYNLQGGLHVCFTQGGPFEEYSTLDSTPPRIRRRIRPRALFWAAFLPLIVLSGLLLNGTLLIPAAFAAPAASYSVPGHNTFRQFLREGNQSKAYQGAFVRPGRDPGALPPPANAPVVKPLPGAEPPTMKDQTYLLDDSFVLHRPIVASSTQPAAIQGAAIPAGSTPFVTVGSDGRLEIDLPRGSLDFAHAILLNGSAPVGQFFLHLHQIAGHFIEAESVLGTYQIQIVDSLGHVIQGVVLTKPVTIVYHYQSWELRGLNLDPAHLHLAWSGLLTSARAARRSSTGLVLPLTNNAKTRTLSATTSVLQGPFTLSGSPVLATPAKPDLFEVSGNTGQYSYSYPIGVAPGPAGFEPHLQLVYSSQATNGRHSARAPAGDEGDGWSLSLGSITAAHYPASSAGGAGIWYSINGVDGVSDKLVPAYQKPNFYETQHISHLLIEWTGSCWNVWGKDGTLFQLGCTPDSQQQTSAGMYEWDVNRVVAPYDNPGQVKLMLVSYLQDSPDGGTTIRDAGIKQIQYGFATSPTASSLSLVSGTVDFHYHMPTVPGGQDAFATAYGTNYNCASSPPASTNLRCDDPGTYNSVLPPDVMATMTLDTVTSYVGTDTGGNPAYRYAFTYQDQPYTTTYVDPYTQVQEAAAGEHLLTQITPSVYLAGIAHTRKAVVFGYSTSGLTDSYYDPNQFAQGSTTIHFSGLTSWNYLTSYEDLSTSVGARISYATAYANMTGTPYVTDGQGNVTDDRFDPLYCTNQANNPDPSKRCTGVYAHPESDSWSLQVVTQISALGTDSSGNPTVATTSYHYALGQADSDDMPVGCNPITGTGVPAQEAACVADTWVPGYANGQEQQDGDWSDYYHSELRGFNIVYISSPAGDFTVDYYFTMAGWWTPAYRGSNYNGGQLYQEDIYQGNVESASKLLRETLNYYPGSSVPSGNPYSNLSACNSNEYTLYAPCVVAPLETKTSVLEKGSSSNAAWLDTKYTYDDFNSTQGYVASGYHNLIQEVISGNNLNTNVYPITKKWTYTTTDQESGPVYYTVDKATHSEIDDTKGHVWACQNLTYDEGRASGVPSPAEGLVTTETSYSTCGTPSTAITSYTAYDQYGNAVATVDPLGVATPSLYSSHGCSVSGIVDLSASWATGHFTDCTTYDTATTAGLPTSQTNALGQTTSLAYDYTSAALPTSSTDANSQVTGYSYSYDGNGNETIGTSEPGESGAYTVRQSENSQCTTSSTLPCYEIDTNSLLSSSAISRTFYDALGRAIETRTPGPTPGDDTIVATVYNDQTHTKWESVPFQVTAGSGWLDPNGATDINGNAPAGTTTFYDALNRAIAVRDPNYGSSQEPGQFCSWGLSSSYTSCTNYTTTGGASSMAEESDTDANGHVVQKQMDALGQVIYVNTYSGAQQNVLEQQTQMLYNALGKAYYIETDDDHAQGGQTITTIYTHLTYDDQGRLLTLIDHDQGTFTYTYDPNGQILSVVQTNGSSSRTLGYNYDLLGRLGCEQTAAPTINWNGACSAGNPLQQNTYDTTFLGTQGTTDFPIGYLTQSVATTYYPDSTSASVTEQFQHDQRGRLLTEQVSLTLPAGWNVTALPSYQETMLYNDADQLTTTSTTGSGGYTFTNVYDETTGVLQGLSNNGNSTANLASLSYNEYAQPGSITLLNGAVSSPTSLASETFNYDGNLRPMSLSATWLSGSGNSGQILSQNRTYGNADNVTGVSTTFAAVPGQSGSGGSETQNFCYDEQNRLVWAGNSGTQPGAGNGTCGSGTLTSGLSGAGYNASYIYTNLGQIWQGPLNGQGAAVQYLYCNGSASGPHQLTGVYSVGTTCANKGNATAIYAAGYDAWGNETSRTYNGITATLSYNILNDLTEYNASNGQEFYVYDADGNRVLKRSISGGNTTLAVYLFGLEEYDYTGNGTLTGQLHYYMLAGHLIGSFDGTTTTFYLLMSERPEIASNVV